MFEALTAEQTGIQFENKLHPNEQFNMFHYMYYYNGAGVATGDFNNDGQADIFFASNEGDNQLYLNKGKLQFTEVSKEAQIPQDSAWNTGVSVVDINNDGLLQEDELEKFRMVLSREKRIREASNEEEIRAALIDIEKTGLLKDEDLENLKRSITERSEDHDTARFHSVEIMQLSNTLEIDRKNLEWEYEIGDKRIQLEIDKGNEAFGKSFYSR